MVDLHSHILANVDDGARSLEESLEMCRLSARDGVRAIVATPHAHDGVHTTHPPELLRDKVDELNRLLGGVPRIELGCELRFTHDVVNHLCGKKNAPTLAGGPYALIEFPSRLIPPGTERALYELLNQQIRPVIAHPERNLMLIEEPQRFHALVEAGALGQLDTGSVTGQFGKRARQAAEVMLENGLLHFIASDCHNTRNRPPGMSQAVAQIAAIVGDEYAAAMSDANPAAVLDGRPILFKPEPLLPKKRRRWIFF